MYLMKTMPKFGLFDFCASMNDVVLGLELLLIICSTHSHNHFS